MQSKTYIKITLLLLLSGLIIIAGMQIAIDPLFQYHTPWFGMEPLITNERYQNAGVARHFDFDNAIIGNSLAENFRVSDVSKAFGGKTVKLTASGSHILDWTYVLNILKNRSSAPDNILFNMDPYIFHASYSELKHEIPAYLYDNIPINDTDYMLNFSVLNDFTLSAIKKNLSGDIPDYDTYRLWDSDFKYGKDFVLSHYTRAEVSVNQAADNESAVRTSKNIELLLPYIADMQDTEFVFFFSPFSMIYWDGQIRNNNLNAEKECYLTACKILSNYKNVILFMWTDDEMLSIMGDLENYVDEAHYSPYVCEIMADRIGKKQGIITSETYKSEINKFFDYLESYDYDSLFN